MIKYTYAHKMCKLYFRGTEMELKRILEETITRDDVQLYDFFVSSKTMEFMAERAEKIRFHENEITMRTDGYVMTMVVDARIADDREIMEKAYYRLESVDGGKLYKRREGIKVDTIIL